VPRALLGAAARASTALPSDAARITAVDVMNVVIRRRGRTAREARAFDEDKRSTPQASQRRATRRRARSTSQLRH
jgi:hypothetical protein